MAYLNPQEKLLIGLIFYSPAIIAFVFGTVIGSLSNVMIFRMVYYKSIWSPPSHCTSCGAEIPGYLNIPLVSYLALRGRCRSCGARFTSRYFWVELASGLMYAIVVLWIYTLPPPQGFGLTMREVLNFSASQTPLLGFPSNPAGIALIFKGWVFATLLLVLSMVDLEHRLLPDRLTLPGIALGLLLSFAAPLSRPEIASLGRSGLTDAFLQSFLGMIVGGGILLVIMLIYPPGMMFGDVKLLAMIGSFVGITALAPSVFLGFVAGGAVGGLVMLISKNYVPMKTYIPFGPFLALGGFVGFLWGSQIWTWYMRLVANR